MLIRRIPLVSAALVALLLPASASAQPGFEPVPVTIREPVGDPVTAYQGTGLCVASAISTDAATDFGLVAETFNGNVNAFMEVHKADRVESVLRTVFDLSNNNNSEGARSYGDFTGDLIPLCGFGGCDHFPVDVFTEFGSRFRGFLNVTEEMAARPMHIGYYADDAVSLAFYDKNRAYWEVVTRPPRLGFSTWRTTNTITFERAGLYPIEINYVEVGEHAALEMSYYYGEFVDYQLFPDAVGAVSLSEAGFTRFEATNFFQTLSGVPSFDDLNTCQQCARQFAGSLGNSGCIPGYFCNEAALCAPCDSAAVCGPTCSPCEGATPFCINVNGNKECGGCRTDFDCRDGFHCDQTTHTCEECTTDDDCPRGEICVENSCQPCESAGTCAGNSCNCCPQGSNGKQMQCASVDGVSAPMCVECIANADCTQGVCDVPTGHCVDEIKTNAKANCCGEDCLTCPADFPFCLPGPVGTACAQCRSDMDCAAENFCLSGECKPCTDDRHCGSRCESCGGDNPFCLGSPVVASALCVRCTADSQCNGGRCDLEKYECEPTCLATCAPETPYCDGTTCVECYADLQCPCGNTCDLATNTCDTSCRDNGDCLGNQHCKLTENLETKQCALGPMPDNVACGGTLATTCGGTIGRRGEDPPPIGLLLLALLALRGRRRAEARS